MSTMLIQQDHKIANKHLNLDSLVNHIQFGCSFNGLVVLAGGDINTYYNLFSGGDGGQNVFV